MDEEIRLVERMYRCTYEVGSTTFRATCHSYEELVEALKELPPETVIKRVAISYPFDDAKVEDVLSDLR